MIVEASFVGFLRTALIIVLIFYAIRFISRLLILNSFRKKSNRDKNAGKNSDKDQDNLGEYIDYEEVDE